MHVKRSNYQKNRKNMSYPVRLSKQGLCSFALCLGSLSEKKKKKKKDKFSTFIAFMGHVIKGSIP